MYRGGWRARGREGGEVFVKPGVMYTGEGVK